MGNQYKYFSVTAKCGHVGRNNYIPIAFAIYATSRTEAASKTRFLPRVKHDAKDAIIEAKEINYEEYCTLKNKNDGDNYLKCHNRQSQKIICTDLCDRIITEKRNDNIHCKEWVTKKRHEKKEMWKIMENDAKKLLRYHDMCPSVCQ